MPPSNAKPEAVAALVEVTLAKPHTHNDKAYAVGDKISVCEADRAWLEEQKVIEPAAK